MSIELNVALPSRTIPNAVVVHHLSIIRIAEGGRGENTYSVRNMDTTAMARFPHLYSEGWERCVSRALAALADAR